MKRSLLYGLAAFLLAVPMALLGVPSAAADTTFIVNNTLVDAPDAAPGDGACLSTSGGCTLRAAVMEANALAGNDTIVLPVSAINLTIVGAGEDGAATGDLDITANLVVNGSSAVGTTIGGGGLDRVFHVRNGATVTIANVTIQNGAAADVGGGLYNDGGNTTINNAIVQDNSAPNGGGIYQSGGSLVISHTTLAANTASASGGGVHPAGGSLTINNSTLGDDGGNGNAAVSGGGLFVPGGVGVTVNNSTFSSNSANEGGGLFASGTVHLNSVTVANNNAIAAGGGILQLGGVVNLRNTLLATNSGPVGPDCAGTLTSQGYNLVGITDGCNGVFNGVNGDLAGNSVSPLNPQISTLGNNGGLTETHSLATNSPANDAGNPEGCGNGGIFSNDQRGAGFPRHVDANLDGVPRCDIGAFERGPTGFTVTPSDTPTASVTPTPSLTPTAPTATPTNTAAPTTPTLPPSATPTPSFTPIAGGKLPPASGEGVGGGGNGSGAVSTVAFPTPGTPFPTPSPDFTQTQIGLTQISLTGTAVAQAQSTPTLIPSLTPTFELPAEGVSLSTSRQVGVEGGGVPCGIFQVSVPEAVAPNGSIFRCETISPQAEARARLPLNHRAFWHIVEITAADPAGQALRRFNPPLTVCAYYQEEYLEAVNDDPLRLVIFTAADSDGRWTALTTTPDPNAPRACAQTDSLSLFRLVATPASWMARVLSPLSLALAGVVCLLLVIVLIVVVVAVARRGRPAAA